MCVCVGGRGALQPCRTEPSPCGTGRYLWADAVRAELKSGTPCWCLRTVCWRGDLGLGTQFTDSLHTAELSNVGRPGDLPVSLGIRAGQGQGGRSRLLHRAANKVNCAAETRLASRRLAERSDGTFWARHARVSPGSRCLAPGPPAYPEGPASHTLGLMILCLPVLPSAGPR